MCFGGGAAEAEGEGGFLALARGPWSLIRLLKNFWACDLTCTTDLVLMWSESCFQCFPYLSSPGRGKGGGGGRGGKGGGLTTVLRRCCTELFRSKLLLGTFTPAARVAKLDDDLFPPTHTPHNPNPSTPCFTQSDSLSTLDNFRGFAHGVVLFCSCRRGVNSSTPCVPTSRAGASHTSPRPLSVHPRP